MLADLRAATVEGVVFPDELPALAEVLPGPDGTFLVQRVPPVDELPLFREESTSGVEEYGSHEWDVFGVDGRYLGVLRFPREFTPNRVFGDAVFGSLPGAYGEPQLVRFRLLRPDCC